MALDHISEDSDSDSASAAVSDWGYAPDLGRGPDGLADLKCLVYAVIQTHAHHLHMELPPPLHRAPWNCVVVRNDVSHQRGSLIPRADVPVVNARIARAGLGPRAMDFFYLNVADETDARDVCAHLLRAEDPEELMPRLLALMPCARPALCV